MNAQQNHMTEDMEKLKEIPKWTRRYAQNRTLTILVLMVMLMLFSMFFAVLVSLLLVLGAAGFSRGNIILGCVGIGALVALLGAYFKCLFIFIRKFGGKNRGLIDQKIDKRIYGKEGTASLPASKSSKKKICLEIVSAVIFFICFFGSWYLAIEGYIAYNLRMVFLAKSTNGTYLSTLSDTLYYSCDIDRCRRTDIFWYGNFLYI
ncbi:MAG: hypothetical protein ACYTBV_21115 [Planctomycetota bacterium]